ncbi:hypothetical protein Hdeb2414_s0019g00542801 [Helianthus debilis subsp. tardiflorus]
MEAEVFGSSYFVAVGFGSQVQRLRVTVHASGFGSVNISQQRLGSWFGLTRSNRVNSVQFWLTPGQLRTR